MGFGWLLAAVALAAPCDGSEVPEVLEAIDAVRSEHRVEMTAMWVSQACTGAPALASGAGQVAASPPDYRPMVDLSTVANDPTLWLAVCSGGLAPLQRMAQVAAKDKRSVVWKGCGLDRHGWFTESEWNGADGLVAISLSTGAALKASGVKEASTRRIVRALAGIGGGDRAEAPSRFPELPPPPPLEVPELEPVDRFDPVEGRPPPVEGSLLQRIGTIGEGHGSIGDVPVGEDLDLDLEEAFAGVGVGGAGGGVAETGSRPGFVERPQVRWSARAKRADERVCKVEVTVRRSGVYGKVDWVDCPEALRKDVEKALEKAAYTPGTDGEEPVRKTFRTRFTVR